MITAVDTNVLIDVFLDDKQFGQKSAQALTSCLNEGALTICGVVFVETMPLFPTIADLTNALAILGIEPAAISMPSFVLAGTSWKDYRQQGGDRSRMVADFLIAAHAQVECDRLLTRDRGFYRRYFKKLVILEPS